MLIIAQNVTAFRRSSGMAVHLSAHKNFADFWY